MFYPYFLVLIHFRILSSRQNRILLQQHIPGKEGTIGCLLHQSPKIYNNVFVFVDLTTLGTLVNFDWLFHLAECSKFQPLISIYRRGSFFINLSAIVLSLQIPGCKDVLHKTTSFWGFLSMSCFVKVTVTFNKPYIWWFARDSNLLPSRQQADALHVT